MLCNVFLTQTIQAFMLRTIYLSVSILMLTNADLTAFFVEKENNHFLVNDRECENNENPRKIVAILF